MDGRTCASEITRVVPGRDDKNVQTRLESLRPEDVVISFIPAHGITGGSIGAALFVSLVSLATGATVQPHVAITAQVGLW